MCRGFVILITAVFLVEAAKHNENGEKPPAATTPAYLVPTAVDEFFCWRASFVETSDTRGLQALTAFDLRIDRRCEP